MPWYTVKMHPLHVYKNKFHLTATLGIIAVPFLFFLLFSKIANLSLPTLLSDLARSTIRLMIAYSIAAIIGWLCAVLFYRGKRAAFALPIFDVLQSFPTFAALPIAVTLWGPSEITIISFLVITIIWPIFFSIISSLTMIRRDWREAATIYNLHGWNYIRYFLWPASRTGLVTGSIIGLGEGWEALIATEIIVNAPKGLGAFFISVNTNTTVTALGILGFLLLIFSINKILWLPLLHWSHKHMEG